MTVRERFLRSSTRATSWWSRYGLDNRHSLIIMADKRKILFLCIGNSCRSQMAEAILRHLAGDRFEALSAGSHPAGFVHPLAIETMRRLNIHMEEQSSKGWDEFTEEPMDVVVTLCDEAAGKACPAWPKDPITAHWSLPDPACHPGTEEERMDLALRVAQRLRTKIEALIELAWSTDRNELTKRLKFLGEI